MLFFVEDMSFSNLPGDENRLAYNPDVAYDVLPGTESRAGGK